jgi:hypothetical protein
MFPGDSPFNRPEGGTLRQLLGDVLQEQGISEGHPFTCKKNIDSTDTTMVCCKDVPLTKSVPKTSRTEYRRLVHLAGVQRAHDEILSNVVVGPTEDAGDTTTTDLRSFADDGHERERQCLSQVSDMQAEANRRLSTFGHRSVDDRVSIALLGEVATPKTVRQDPWYYNYKRHLLGTKRDRRGGAIATSNQAAPWTVFTALQYRPSREHQFVRSSWEQAVARGRELPALRALQEMAVLVRAAQRIQVGHRGDMDMVHQQIQLGKGGIGASDVAMCLRYGEIPRRYSPLATYTGHVPKVGDGIAETETHRLVAASILKRVVRMALGNDGRLPDSCLQGISRAGTPLGGVDPSARRKSFLAVVVDVPVNVAHTIQAFLGGTGLCALRGTCRATYAMEPGPSTQLCLTVHRRQTSYNQAIVAAFQNVHIRTTKGAAVADIRTLVVGLYFKSPAHIHSLHLEMTPLRCMDVLSWLSGRAGTDTTTDWDVRGQSVRHFRATWTRAALSGDGRDDWLGFFGLVTALFPHLRGLHVQETVVRLVRDPVLECAQRASVTEDFAAVHVPSAASVLRLIRRGLGTAHGLETQAAHRLVERMRQCLHSIQHLSICASQNGQPPFLQLCTKFRSLVSLTLSVSPICPGTCVLPIFLQTMAKNPSLETVRLDLGRYDKDMWRVESDEDRSLLDGKACIPQGSLYHWSPALREFEVVCMDPGILATVPKPPADMLRRHLRLYLREGPLALSVSEMSSHARRLVRNGCSERPMSVAIVRGGNWDSTGLEPTVLCEKG